MTEIIVIITLLGVTEHMRGVCNSEYVIKCKCCLQWTQRWSWKRHVKKRNIIKPINYPDHQEFTTDTHINIINIINYLKFIQTLLLVVHRNSRVHFLFYYLHLFLSLLLIYRSCTCSFRFPIVLLHALTNK